MAAVLVVLSGDLELLLSVPLKKTNILYMLSESENSFWYGGLDARHRVCNVRIDRAI